jgi:protein-tyrosine phosphatase
MTPGKNGLQILEERCSEIKQILDPPMKAKKVSMTKTSISHPLRIDEVKVPDGRFEELWKSAGPRLRQILLDGGKILIHCRGGIGRTGTVAAQLLVELGMPHEKAIKAVRAARYGTIETRDQERSVSSL